MSDPDPTIQGEIIRSGVELVKLTYVDAVKPGALQVGHAVETLGKTVNLALAPLRGLIWGGEKVEEWVSRSVQERLNRRGVPSERIQTPQLSVAVPALEALRYSDLRENFANLLASAMDALTAPQTHPAFVEILKQLSPDEAKILKLLYGSVSQFPLLDLFYTLPDGAEAISTRNATTLGADAGCTIKEMVPAYIDNLCRLGLCEIPPGWEMDTEKYPINAILKENAVPGKDLKFKKKIFNLTTLGFIFCEMCIEENGGTRKAPKHLIGAKQVLDAGTWV